MKKLLLILFLTISSLFSLGQGKYYLSASVNQPWGSPSNINAMNQAFGAGTWTQAYYPSVNVNALFSPTTCLIFMEGGDSHALALNTFLLANLPAIQNWVNAGGRLLINAAPNQGGNMNYGFGGVMLNYNFGPYSATGNNAPGQAGHPIFNTPFLPCGTAFTGNWWCHGYITGPVTQLVIGTTPGCSLGELNWGAGKAMFGSMTTPNWHLPTPNSANFLANVLRYLYVCCPTPTINIAASPTVICSGQSTTITANGAGVGGNYTITPPIGNIITNSVAVFTPTSTGIYTVVGTTSTNCVGNNTVQIIVNPTPTILPSNSSPICRGSNLNLNVNAPIGGTLITYNWVGPNGFNNNQQNPILANSQPSNTGIYTITVINSFTTGTTCQNTNTTNVIIVNSNSISVSNQTLCQGSNLNLSANAIGANSYSWTGPNSFTSNIQNPSINNILPINGGSYIINAYFTSPGTTLVCNSTATSNISIIATSPVTLNIPNDVCQNSLVNLNASAIGFPTYNWVGPNSFTSNISNPFINNIQPINAGLYSVTAVWSLGTVSCNIGNSGLLNVIGVNSININPSVSVCYPSNVNLISNSNGAISYNWIGPNSFTSNIQNPILTSPNINSTGIYTVTAAFTNGNLICYNSNTTQVTINPILTFTLPSYNKICYNTDFLINGPVGASSYTWTGPLTFSSNVQNLNIPLIQTNQAGTYTLEVNLGPCKTSQITQVDIISPIQFTNSPSNKTICKGDTVNLFVNCIGGTGNYAYYWSPYNSLSGITGTSQIANPQGTTFYNISAYDIACPNNTINTQFIINVNTAPTPSLELENNKCEPYCTLFNSKIGEESNYVLYDFGSKKIQGDSIKICLDAGNYNLNIQTLGNNGCKGIFNYGLIKINHKPGVNFTWDPNPITDVSNNNVIFYPTTNYGNNIIYNWSFLNDGITTNTSIKNPEMVYENQGKYPVALVVNNEWGCKDTIIKILEVEEDCNIYIPNAFTPNGSNLNDLFYPITRGIKEYYISIYDRWGELLLNNIKNGKWDGKYKGIMSKDGVYIYKIIAIKNDGTYKEFVGHVTLMK